MASASRPHNKTSLPMIFLISYSPFGRVRENALRSAFVTRVHLFEDKTGSVGFHPVSLFSLTAELSYRLCFCDRFLFRCFTKDTYDLGYFTVTPHINNYSLMLRDIY